jgi:hypothetical protein
VHTQEKLHVLNTMLLNQAPRKLSPVLIPFGPIWYFRKCEPHPFVNLIVEFVFTNKACLRRRRDVSIAVTKVTIVTTERNFLQVWKAHRIEKPHGVVYVLRSHVERADENSLESMVRHEQVLESEYAIAGIVLGVARQRERRL